MNYIKHLTGFFDKVVKDRDLNPTHVSLYIALFQFWNCNRFKNPISISRDEVMRISKISSKATYHKCLKNLHALGYINYEPSYNPFKGSQVYIFNLSDELKPISKSEKNTPPINEPINKLVSEQVANKSFTSSETATEQALVPYINNTNIPNISNNLKILNFGEQAKKNKEDVIARSCEAQSKTILENEKNDEKEKKLRQKKKEFFFTSSAVEKLTFEEVKSYFIKQNFPELEAQKFFNYFSSIGWLVGGKIPMIDWQSAAQNWILNAPKFISYERTDKTKQLDNSADKDYSEPL